MPPPSAHKFIKRPRYKGLGRGGVCLLQQYCPFCFKGTIGVSCGLYVTKESRLIDQVQVLHSARGNGLPPLDLASPGDFCENHELCKLTCLVCGKATIDGADPEFGLFLDFFGGDEEQPMTLKYEINQVMEQNELVWTDQWDTPVHQACSKKIACKCVVPVGATTCRTHAPRMPARPPPVVQQQQQKQRAAKAEVFKPAIIIAASKPVVRVTAASGLVLEKASWLPPPSMAAATVSTSHLPSAVSPLHPPKKKPVPPKPNVQSMRLEAAGATCAFKITQWAGEHPTNARLSKREGKDETEAKDGKGVFSWKRHYEKFDVRLHGAWKIGGVEGYKRGDNVFIPTSSAVNILHDDGTMSPG